jgi:hypothetical protein
MYNKNGRIREEVSGYRGMLERAAGHPDFFILTTQFSLADSKSSSYQKRPIVFSRAALGSQDWIQISGGIVRCQSGQRIQLWKMQAATGVHNMLSLSYLLRPPKSEWPRKL